MTSKAATVGEWMEEVPAERRVTMERLRDLCRATLAGYEECMAYGMPGYRRAETLEVAFNSQKQHIALYVMKKEVVDEFRAELKGASIGKGCIRFTRPEKMDFAVIERLLRRNVASAAAAC